MLWGSIGEGMVPLFEEHSTRLERNITIEDWMELDPLEKAMMIAIRRIGNSIQNIQTDTEIREAKKKAKRK